ncbi:MAG TPA: SusC/RagA family TonB-linked outer membrane protein [Longimicrobiaceae bacterium]|nr:SusC/RagA family TonB-linked outer membrane protein [Longimicrobiaceae bacterium]
MGHFIRIKLGLLAAILAAMLVTSPPPLQAQSTGTVSGRVTESGSQRALAGAQVSIPGTGRRTVTGPGGEYTLAGVPSGPQTLRVELIGYTPLERRVTVSAGQTATANFEMGQSAVALDALVVTGTAGGTQRRAVGTSVAQIRATDVVETSPVNSVQELINGRAPGVVIIPGSGTVGSGARIRVRGISSLSLSQEPLIYVDGVRVNNAQATGPINQGFSSNTISRWNDFNPEEIESIEIIKGPAAATLYGTEAANGVIQIITKRGSEGAPRFTASIRQGANWFANPEGRLPLNYGRASATAPVTTIDYRTLRELNGDIFGTGHLQEYDFGVSGGSSGIRYYIGGGFERNEGVEPNNVARKYNARANISMTPGTKVDVNASAGYVSGRTSLPLEAGGGGLFWTTLFANPANLNTPRNGFHSATPEAYYYAYEDWQDVDRFTGSFQVTHRPFGWLTHRVALGTDFTNQDDVELVQRIADPAMQFFFTPSEIRGYKDMTRRNVYYNTADYSATAELTPFAGVTSNTSVGAQYYRRYSEFVYARGNEFPVRGLRSIDAAIGIRTNGEDYVENSTVGVFLQEQIGLRDERLFLTGAIRLDDNSAFGESFDLVRYPKLSATWVVSEEPFWSIPFVNTLKLRGAYGESGQQPQSFAALRTFFPITGTGDQPAVTPQSLGNPELGPERSGEVELGFDAGFLDDRLGLEFTYYNRRTTDAILLRDVAPSTGFGGNPGSASLPGQQYINAGEIRNSGVELLARATPLNGRRAQLDLTLSLATNDNEIVDLGIENLSFVSAGTLVQHREGYPVGSWFDRRVVNASFDASGRLIPNSEICDDGNGGEVPCASAPTVFLGRPTPSREGSLSSTLTLFRNLRIYGMLDFKQGFYKLDGNLRVRCVLFLRCRENFYPTEYLNDPAWLAQVQRGGAFADRLIKDASFTRFRELSATYILPGSWAGRFGASRASLTVAGRNLWTWTDYTGLEPEASFLGGTRGTGSAQWEQNVTPQLQQFVTTLNITF